MVKGISAMVKGDSRMVKGDSAMPKEESGSAAKAAPKVPSEVYEAELFRLQTEFVKLQEWTKATGARIVVLFEGQIGRAHV